MLLIILLLSEDILQVAVGSRRMKYLQSRPQVHQHPEAESSQAMIKQTNVKFQVVFVSQEKLTYH